jgi:simple sugar transport system ATP-binding protein
MTNPPVVEMIGIDKAFPGVNALQRVNFRLFPGEIHALMGQNGAGKSTLINVLTGVHAHDAGEIRVGGAPVNFAAPREAEAAGIQTLYQEVNLCANLSVAENIFAGRQPMRRGAIDWKAIHARATRSPSSTCRSTSRARSTRIRSPCSRWSRSRARCRSTRAC